MFGTGPHLRAMASWGGVGPKHSRLQDVKSWSGDEKRLKCEQETLSLLRLATASRLSRRLPLALVAPTWRASFPFARYSKKITNPKLKRKQGETARWSDEPLS